MRTSSRIGAAVILLAAASALLAGGCGKTDQEPKKDGEAKAAVQEKPRAGGETKHDEWWCKEHGIPEDECSLCQATANAKRLAKECKTKGDWCDKHKRALSQCFICDPKRKEFYAAKYRAKYGKEPPPIENEE